MIKRLHGRKSHGTLVANPRRKKRNGGHKRRRRSARALFANPGHKRKKHKKRNPGLSAMLKKNASRKRHHKRRNPSFNLGIDLMSVGVGSVAAIALSSVGQGVFDKYLSNTVQNPQLRAALPSLLVAGAAFATGKYVKNEKVKKIAKITMILSIYKAIDDGVGGAIKDSVKNVLPSFKGGAFGGSYIPALKGNMGGAYIDAATGGAYMHTHGILPSANLYGL